MYRNGFQRYLEFIVFTIVSLLTRTGQTTTMQCDAAKGSTAIDQRLVGYSFRTLQDIGINKCARECFNRPSCISFNFHTNRTCELHAGSDSGQPGSLQQYTGYTYSSINTWTGFPGNCTRSSCCCAGHRCFEFTSTTQCIYTECMNPPLFGVVPSVETAAVGESFMATCKTGYEPRGIGANVTCLGSGVWEISSSYCYRTYSSNWTLVARFGSGNGDSVYDTWQDTGRDDNNDAQMLDECKETANSSVCTRHFRSGLIDQWSTIKPTEVKFALYSAGTEVVYATFDASNTDSLSWFAKSRLLSSSYTDLNTQSTTNHFSIAGAGTSRRFYINRSYGGCPSDYGWIQTIDAKGTCFYDDAVAFPKFLYSPNNVTGHVGIDSLVADVLAIFVKI